MKQFVATLLLLGYVMLVPFCFFGGMLMANTGTMHMDDCGMSLGGCAHGTGAGGMDTVSHHVGMYNSITQTPLAALSLVFLAATAFLLSAFSLSFDWIASLRREKSLRFFTRRKDGPRNKIKRLVLTWLSLFETSPNFA